MACGHPAAGLAGWYPARVIHVGTMLGSLHVGTLLGGLHVGTLLRGLHVGTLLGGLHIVTMPMWASCSEVWKLVPCSGVWWDNRETGGYAATRVAQIALKLSKASIIQAHPFYKCNSDR